MTQDVIDAMVKDAMPAIVGAFANQLAKGTAGWMLRLRNPSTGEIIHITRDADGVIRGQEEQ